MGSSDNETCAVDCSVGAIVWVRRRNGSWWPGKILGPEELSAVHRLSPRSGTPVKLLGREDASVDWYNLEKSKRVKPFRCGEFDDSIERAEYSQAMAPKKREKYARREDAILHALELEKQLVGGKYGTLGRPSNGMSNKSSGAVEELVAPSECSGYRSGEKGKSHSNKLDSSLVGKSLDSLNVKNVEERNPSEGDEDNSEIVPRMRDLQDFGLTIASSKRKLSSYITMNSSSMPECADNALALPSGSPGTENMVHACVKGSLDKKRKSHALLSDDSLARRCGRRRFFGQVLQSSEKLPVHHPLGVLRSHSVYLCGESCEYLDDKQTCPNQMLEASNCHPTGLGEDSTSESTENTETDSSETDSHDSDADEDMMVFSDVVLEAKSLGRPGGRVQHESMDIEKPVDLALSSDMSHLCPEDPVLPAFGVSRWKLKGKRNNRGLANRFIDTTNRRVLRGFMYGTNLGESKSSVYEEPHLIGKNFRAQRRASDYRGYLLNSKFTSIESDDTTHNTVYWDDLACYDQPAMKGYWEDSSNYIDPVFFGRHNFGGRMKSLLIDVDLKVQSSYQRAHVPMISLMSKFNGHAIVGHPIQIEALENGSCDNLLSTTSGVCPETSDNDTSFPPAWTTARRRANIQVRRSHPSTGWNGEQTRCSGHKASMMGKSLSHASSPLVVSRKPVKKMGLSSSQKTKPLSSIGSLQKLGCDIRCGDNNYQVDGQIKRESGPAAVACIPVKLIFSRLYEELIGRHQQRLVIRTS